MSGWHKTLDNNSRFHSNKLLVENYPSPSQEQTCLCAAITMAQSEPPSLSNLESSTTSTTAITPTPVTPVTPDRAARPRFSSRVGKAPPQPTSVKINVEGAFIVNDEPVQRNGASEYVHWEHKDIRLPHHTDVVSHVAVDVSFCCPPFKCGERK